MFSRPILRKVELWLARGADNTWKRREFGNGAVAEYQVRELLDRSRYLYGMHEFVTSSVFVAHIPVGSVVLDIGANLGEYTVLAAQATGGQGRVIAFEPNPLVRDRLLRNIKANGFHNVEVCANALGLEDGVGVLSAPSDESGLGSMRLGVGGTEFPVEVRRLDGVLSEQDRARISVIKLDVEGFELEILQGARVTIDEARPIVLYECAEDTFETRHGKALTPVMEFLESAGYDNFVMKMSRGGRWALERAIHIDPRRYREPWEVLMVVGIHRDKVGGAEMSGDSLLRPCTVFEFLGR
jgi:FkbM family methyltransferase